MATEVKGPFKTLGRHEIWNAENVIVHLHMSWNFGFL